MKSRKKGFTLVELLVVTVLLGMLMTILYSIYLLSSKTFSDTQRQYDIQTDYRLATDFITKELRNATEIEIISTSSVPAFDSGYRYFYINNKDLMYYSNGSTVKKVQSQVENTNVFQVKGSGPYFLHVLFDGKNHNRKYDVTTEVRLNNITSYTLVTTSGNVIKYKPKYR